MKKGFTLIELIVAMAVFIVVATITVSSFMMISNLESLASTMRESQEETRVALATISRLAQGANTVTIPNPQTLDLFFQTQGVTNGVQFEIVNGELLYWNGCNSSDLNVNLTAALSCSAWSDNTQATNMLAGSASKIITLNGSTSSFVKTMQFGSPELQIVLNGTINQGTPNPFYSDQMSLQSSVTLSGLQ